MFSVSEKIISKHLISGEMIANEPIEISIDQTLTQDATGTMCYLQLEAMKVDRVKTELSVSYVDHNTLQNGFENADDHLYLQTVADKHGIIYSKCGNGICHQLHLERFAKPYKTLLGSDSHTPTSSAIGCLAIGAGGLDVACAMAGRSFRLNMPKIVNIVLENKLSHGVTSKDIILELLRIFSVKGGVGKIFEYSGSGLKYLSIPERGTIANMGAELGLTSSIFPSDEVTHEFLNKQKRKDDWQELLADEGCHYDEQYVIDLSSLKPLAACPNSPDNIEYVEKLVGKKVDQVLIGSCTNSSYTDLLEVANILKGHKVHPDVSLGISFGSKQVLRMLMKSGALDDIVQSGARILEATCGPCIGMGQSPKTNAVSLRTFNRNFYGRSGTLSAGIYLVSPVTAAISAINGVISDPMLVDFDKAYIPNEYLIDDSMFLKPTFTSEVIQGPNIKPLPINTLLEEDIDAKVMIKVNDNITTDHIMPAGAKVLPYRSNIEKISEFCFYQIDPYFHDRCIEHNGGIIIAGNNYGQGSSREHAALAPMYLKIKAVIAKSYARIHKQNLINSGILPLYFNKDEDYESIDLLDELFIEDSSILNSECLTVINKTKNKKFVVKHDLTSTQIMIIKNGGLLNAIKEGAL